MQNVDEYQAFATSTRTYPAYSRVLYPLLGLVGEVGETVALFTDRMWPYGQPTPDGQEAYRDALTALVAIGRRCETLKKQIRGGRAGLTASQEGEIEAGVEAFRQDKTGEMTNEASDVCWYVSALLSDLGVRFSDALAMNVKKLSARKAQGTIHNHQPDSKEHLEVK